MVGLRPLDGLIRMEDETRDRYRLKDYSEAVLYLISC